MKLSAKTKIDDLLKAYPFLEDFFVRKSPKFSHLKNPFMRKTIGKVATLKQVAGIGNIPISELLSDIAKAVEAQTHETVTVLGVDPESAADSIKREEILKGIIRDLHRGEDIEVLKQRFKDLIQEVSPSEIAGMEQRLIEEGMPETEVRRLCDVHVQIFKESLEKHEIPGSPPGHPVHTLMKENRAAEQIMGRMEKLIGIGDADSDATLKSLIDQLSKIHLHYLKKENQLFPLLETHQISGPSQVMWGIHDDIRAKMKKIQAPSVSLHSSEAIAELKELTTAVKDMIYKEEHILFPMSLETLSDTEWGKVKQGEEEIGYAWIEPDAGWASRTGDVVKQAAEIPKVALDTGALTPDQMNRLLTHLPLDITFVDENDRVAYYSSGKERIFPRSPGIIGREVQKCHPPKSIHIVEKILSAFKSGTKNEASFWINVKGKFILIRYVALRSKEGAYKGCLEISQDVTGIRNLEGERRLLNWDD